MDTESYCCKEETAWRTRFVSNLKQKGWSAVKEVTDLERNRWVFAAGTVTYLTASGHPWGCIGHTSHQHPFSSTHRSRLPLPKCVLGARAQQIRPAGRSRRPRGHSTVISATARGQYRCVVQGRRPGTTSMAATGVLVKGRQHVNTHFLSLATSHERALGALRGNSTLRGGARKPTSLPTWLGGGKCGGAAFSFVPCLQFK